MKIQKNYGDKLLYTMFFAVMVTVLYCVIWAGNHRFDIKRAELVPLPQVKNFSKDWTLWLEEEPTADQPDPERQPNAANQSDPADHIPTKQISLPHRAETAPGQAIVIQKQLPQWGEYENAICFHTAFSSVEAWAGERLIYRYDSADTRPFGRSTPSRWNLVRLPQQCRGQELTIRVVSPYRISSGGLSPIWMGDPLKLVGYLLGQYMPQYLLCGIFFALGAALITSSVILRKSLGDACTLRCLGIFICMASAWMLTEVEFSDLLLNHPFMLSLARYLLVMTCPLPYLLYLLHRLPEPYRPTVRRLFGLFTANFFLMTVLQVLNIADFTETIWVTFFCLLVMFLSLFMVFWKRYRTERPVGLYFSLEAAGIVFLFANVLTEVYLYSRMEYMRNGNFMRLGLFGYIVCLLLAVLIDWKNSREEMIKLGTELQESRLRLMISQIQPHFIYNTLSSVRTLIKLDPDKAYDLVYDFSKYLRANIDSIGQESRMIPFSVEIEHVRNYCNIEKIRFGDKLSLIYEIEEKDFQIPPLTVQPLVENAIKHGLRGKEGNGTVKIRSYFENDCYVIEVLDDGIGFDTGAEPAKYSAGLKNIRLRLKEMAGGRLEIVSLKGKGTKAVIYLPGEEKE